MNRILIFFFLTITFFSAKKLNASHIVGGYLNYTCIGPVSNDSADYSVTMFFYRDCINANPVVVPINIPITIFNTNNSQVGFFRLNKLTSLDTIAPTINNPCVKPDTLFCVEEFIFSGTIRLARANSHKLVYQRCCKSSAVTNIPTPSNDFGSTFTIDIPSFNQVSCNSTPIYDTIPPLYFCVGFDVNVDLSATDPDGDSLVYSLCNPLDYNVNQGPPLPIPANPPPYASLPFINGLSATNPIPANPQLTLNSRTGLLTGTPTNIARYVFGICIEEYRNGQLINIMRREIEVSSKVCDVIVNSNIADQDQEQICDGLTVKFINNSSPNTINNYFWDFGVSGINSDTSNLFEPSYTFPDTGLYFISLISFPDFLACTDTIIDTFRVKALLDPIIIQNGVFCADNRNIDLSIGGSIESYATVKWNFGPMASIQTSTSRNITGLSYPPGANSYPIELISEQNGCTDTLVDVIIIYENLTADFTVSATTGCAPISFQFTSNVVANIESTISYLWNFGDGKTSTLANPVNMYTTNGNFNVSLQITTLGGCEETVIVSKPSLVNLGTSFSPDTASFTFDNPAGCFPHSVQFVNTSIFSGIPNYLWNFGDGTSSTATNPIKVYQADGVYDVSLTMTTTGACAQTVSSIVDDAIKVSLDSSTNIADFIVGQDTGCAPVEITFTNTSVFQGSANFLWSFGDGKTSTEQNPTHLYETTGIYDVELILNATDKCIETVTKLKPSLIETSPIFSTNEINFDYFPKEGCPPLTVQFSDSSKFVGKAKYFWDFGDGTLDTVQNPVKIYNDTGRYSIGLLLIPFERCADTLVETISDGIRVLPRPIAKIIASDSASTIKTASFIFSNNGSQFVTSSRYLINGVEVAVADILNHQFTDTGSFVVDYIASNSFGCEDTSSAKIFIFDEFQFVIPNVFTPNGDNINDEFRMQSCGVYDFGIKIFNRFGEQVFKSNSLEINWDGRISGKKASEGTYFYTIKILDFRNKILDYSGSITLLRD